MKRDRSLRYPQFDDVIWTLRGRFAQMFLDRKKTGELRSTDCKMLQPGDVVYLAKTVDKKDTKDIEYKNYGNISNSNSFRGIKSECKSNG